MAIIANKLSYVVKFDTCAIYLYDESTGFAVAEHVTGEHAEYLRGRKITPGEGITGYVLANQKPMANTAAECQQMIDASKKAGNKLQIGYRMHWDAPTLAAGEVELEVTNTAVVPISVTSHFHFFEANPRLRFDRAAAYGMHLAVTAGAAVRFEPGGTRRVGLVPIGGRRVVIGFAGLVDGPLDAPGARERALEKARACGYADSAAGS